MGCRLREDLDSLYLDLDLCFEGRPVTYTVKVAGLVIVNSRKAAAA
jgi:hypothetical protein